MKRLKENRWYVVGSIIVALLLVFFLVPANLSQLDNFPKSSKEIKSIEFSVYKNGSYETLRLLKQENEIDALYNRLCEVKVHRTLGKGYDVAFVEDHYHLQIEVAEGDPFIIVVDNKRVLGFVLDNLMLFKSKDSSLQLDNLLYNI